jgi:hypothetical protein
MMVPLLFLAATSADLDALNQSVELCNRKLANPVFSAETGRRSQFMLDAFREQETIVAARLDLAERRRTLRDMTGAKGSDDERSLAIAASQIEDRQRALNDRRMLEGIRRETIDSMRRYFLAHCASGKDKS